MEYKDYSYLIKKSNDIINKYKESFIVYDFDIEKAFKSDVIEMDNRSAAKHSLVLAEDTGLELGAPAKKSVNLTMWTKEQNLVSGKLIIAGNDLGKMSSDSVSFMQVALLDLGDSSQIDDFGMSRVMNMTNKIPGYMTRNMSGRIWSRIHKNLLKSGFDLYTLGQSIYKVFFMSYSYISKIDIILAADNENIISEFETVANAARSIAGDNKKLKWVEDGLLTCEELNCNTCEEKPTCDTLRDIIITKQKKSPNPKGSEC